jgi:hypothetical protein
MFAVVWSADALIASARRRPDPLRRTAIISFITGLFCAAFALSWALALFSVLLAPAGVAAGSITWRKETAHGEPHSGLNITGLILNGFALLVAIFQAWLAIYLAGR